MLIHSLMTVTVILVTQVAVNVKVMKQLLQLIHKSVAISVVPPVKVVT